MGKKKNPSTAEDPGSSSVKASRRSQRFSLQPSHALSQTLTYAGVAKHLDRRPWLRPEYIRRSYSPSVASEGVFENIIFYHLLPSQIVRIHSSATLYLHSS